MADYSRSPWAVEQALDRDARSRARRIRHTRLRQLGIIEDSHDVSRRAFVEEMTALRASMEQRDVEADDLCNCGAIRGTCGCPSPGYNRRIGAPTASGVERIRSRAFVRDVPFTGGLR